MFMSIFNKIKSYLPVSSRSFHGFWKDENNRFGLLTEAIEEKAVLLENVIRSEISYNLSLKIDELTKDLDAHDTHMKLLTWSVYKKPNESLIDAKKRFFKELPASSGSMRLLQMGCARLIRGFNEILPKQ